MTVVASEVASAFQKGAKKAAAVTLLGTQLVTMTLGGMAVPGEAQAANANYSLVPGKIENSVTGGIAIGYGSFGTGADAVAVGSSANATETSSIAIGAVANATADFSIAVGRNASATQQESMAFGYKANAIAEDSIALGSNATASSISSLALGAGAGASIEGSVALGSESKTSVDKNVLGKVYNGTTWVESANIASTWNATHAAVSVGDGTNITRQITGVAAGSEDTDAVNLAQLKSVSVSLNVNNGTAATGDTYTDDGNLLIKRTAITGGGNTYDIKLNDSVALGQNGSADGQLVVSNKEDQNQVNINGSEISVTDVTANGTTKVSGSKISVTDATANKTTEITSTKIQTGDVVLNGSDNTVKVGTSSNATSLTETVMKTGSVSINGATDDNAANTITVSSANGTTTISGEKISVGPDTTIEDKKITMGDATYSDSGMTIKNGPTITKTKVDMGGNKITNVGRGEVSATSTDAVNGSQLYETNQAVAQNDRRIQELAETDKKLSRRINRAGANAAALAALHPQDYDEDHKFSGAVGLGHYRGQQAIAVGMFARPSENLMFSLGSSIAGRKETMFNAGLSYRFGAPNQLKTVSKSEMAGRINDLNASNRDLSARLAASEAREENAQKRLANANDRIAKLEADMAKLMKMVYRQQAKGGQAAVRKVQYKTK